MTLYDLLNALQQADSEMNHDVVISDGNHQFQILDATLVWDMTDTMPRSVIAIHFDTNS